MIAGAGAVSALCRQNQVDVGSKADIAAGSCIGDVVESDRDVGGLAEEHVPAAGDRGDRMCGEEQAIFQKLKGRTRQRRRQQPSEP